MTLPFNATGIAAAYVQYQEILGRLENAAMELKAAGHEYFEDYEDCKIGSVELHQHVDVLYVVINLDSRYVENAGVVTVGVSDFLTEYKIFEEKKQ